MSMSIQVLLSEGTFDKNAPNIIIKDDGGGYFEIMWGANLDLYFISNKSKVASWPQRFVISHTDGFIYLAFLSLYNEITHFRIFEDVVCDKRMKNEVLSTGLFDPKTGVITWKSDDGYNELRFKRDKQKIYFEFVKTKPKVQLLYLRNRYEIPIRFRTSGSRYHYGYIPFVRLYQRVHGYYKKILCN